MTESQSHQVPGFALLGPHRGMGTLNGFGGTDWPDGSVFEPSPPTIDSVGPLNGIIPPDPWDLLAKLCAQVPGGAPVLSAPAGAWCGAPDAHSWLRAWGGTSAGHPLADLLMNALTRKAWRRYDGKPYVFALGEDEADDFLGGYEPGTWASTPRSDPEADQPIWAAAHPRDALLLAAWVGMLCVCQSGVMFQPDQDAWWTRSTRGAGAEMCSIDRIAVARLWSTWVGQDDVFAHDGGSGTTHRAVRPDRSCSAPPGRDWLNAAAWAGAALIAPSHRTYMKFSPFLDSAGLPISGKHELFDLWSAASLPGQLRLDVLYVRSLFLDDQGERGVSLVGRLFPANMSELVRQARAVWAQAVLEVVGVAPSVRAVGDPRPDVLVGASVDASSVGEDGSQPSERIAAQQSERFSRRRL